MCLSALRSEPNGFPENREKDLKLMLSLMTFLRRQSENKSLRNYERDEWGKLSGETCVIEFSGLAAQNSAVL
jgi:hypothetical protein